MMTLASEPVADAKRAFTSVRRLRFSVLLVSLPFGMILLGLPLVAREMGASALMIGGLLSVSALIIVSVLPSRLGGFSDRIGRRPPLVGALLMGCVATLAVPFVQSLWPLALLWVFEAAVFAAAIPAEEALVVDISGSERPGVTLGFLTGAAGLGAVIGPLLGGWLYDRFGAMSVFGTAALVMPLGTGSVLLFVREPSHPRGNQ